MDSEQREREALAAAITAAAACMEAADSCGLDPVTRALSVLDWIDYAGWLLNLEPFTAGCAWDARCRGPLGRWAVDGIPTREHGLEYRELTVAGETRDSRRHGGLGLHAVDARAARARRARQLTYQPWDQR